MSISWVLPLHSVGVNYIPLVVVSMVSSSSVDSYGVSDFLGTLGDSLPEVTFSPDKVGSSFSFSSDVL